MRRDTSPGSSIVQHCILLSQQIVSTKLVLDYARSHANPRYVAEPLGNMEIVAE